MFTISDEDKINVQDLKNWKERQWHDTSYRENSKYAAEAAWHLATVPEEPQI